MKVPRGSMQIGLGSWLTPSGEILVDPIIVERSSTPYCDCNAEMKRKAARRGGGTLGYTKRDDGVWVRPCCMRRERAAWEKWGDSPVPGDYLQMKEAARKGATPLRKPRKKRK